MSVSASTGSSAPPPKAKKSLWYEPRLPDHRGYGTRRCGRPPVPGLCDTAQDPGRHLSALIKTAVAPLVFLSWHLALSRRETLSARHVSALWPSSTSRWSPRSRLVGLLAGNLLGRERHCGCNDGTGEPRTPPRKPHRGWNSSCTSSPTISSAPLRRANCCRCW